MKRTIWILVLVVVLGGFVGFQQYSSWSLNKPQVKSEGKVEQAAKGQSSERSQGRPGGQGRGGGSREALPVLVATAVQKALPVQLRAVGNAEAYATVAIKSQVTGVLLQAHFEEGQDVKKGQLLFTIDPRPFESSVKQAEAALARDSAQLQNAREQARRYAELVKKQYISQEQHDQFRTNAEALEAVVEADKAVVENAKVQLSYCYIYSPMNGRVGALLVNEGNLIRVNDGTPLVVINQVTPINVTFSVPEHHLGDIKKYMATRKLVVDALPPGEGHREQGTLSFVDNAVDRPTGTVKLKAVFTNSDRRLWPGQFVNVALTLATQPNAVVIPSEAVQRGPEGEHVFVIQPDKKVEMRPVAVGWTSEGEAVIAKGIAVGEQVVREGQFLLGPGSKVEIKEAGVGPDSSEVKRGRGKGEGKGERKKEGNQS
ncbi:MAG: efflux RND transporter periplasmic adaptor subunit [Candidatus Latescibacterota bacterium]